MATCSNCGHEMKDTESFCTNCGARREIISPAPPPPSVPPEGNAYSPPPPPGTPPSQPGYMPPQTPPPSQYQAGKKRGMGRGAKIAIIVGLVVILLVIGVIAVGVLVFWKAISGPADTANAFVEAINDGNLSEAYDLFSTEAKREESRRSFDEKMEVFKGGIASWNTTSINVENNRATVEMDLEDKEGDDGSMEINLVKESGEWKVYNFYIDVN